jgi:hypothetical protein
MHTYQFITNLQRNILHNTHKQFLYAHMNIYDYIYTYVSTCKYIS